MLYDANGVIVNDTKCSKPQGDSASIYQLSSCMHAGRRDDHIEQMMIIGDPAMMLVKVKSIVMITLILVKEM